ncbi:MAG: HD domain-containing protein [Chloroflexi bacterium]|nr:MAG: HD domain-containing protein [Chloroflexota bacterium]MBL1196804.1 HD domain-containing protein [Chloroflexota bacterium]NOH14099.1 HD domain-containing protein [Chloroflexota bacterium]
MVEDENKPENNGSSDPYAGRWIARVGDQIVGQGNTREEAQQAAKAARHKDKAEISFSSLSQGLKLGPVFTKLQALFSEKEEVYLIGGAVRDALLGKASHDLDFTVPKNALKIARKTANKLEGAYYRLGDEHEIGRVVLTEENGKRQILDFADVRGPDLESDLRGRDFTINAIALNIHKPDELIDPLGGLVDLRTKRLKACSPHSFTDDPVRILRAIRFAIFSKYAMDDETKQWMRAATDQLPKVSAERVRDELFRILDGPQPATALRTLDMLGALQHVLPELEKLKEVKQSPPHIYDVWEHSLQTVQKLEKVLAALDGTYEEDTVRDLTMGEVVLRLGRYRQPITELVDQTITPERSWRPSLYLAALYHDVGKPDKRSQDEDGRIRFISHELRSADIITERARALQLSNVEVKRLKTVVENHMRPFNFARTGKMPTRRSIYRYFRATGEAGVDVALLSIADMLAIYGTTLPHDLLKDWINVVRELLEAWFEQAEEKVLPPALVDGDDLMRVFELEPGPQIGQLLEAIREAQAAGEVEDKKGALDLARQMIEESQ